jgi:hypothetical protein
VLKLGENQWEGFLGKKRTPSFFGGIAGRERNERALGKLRE